MAFSKPKAHERAERYAAKGQHDRAAREYQLIVDNDPTDIRAWLMLADCMGRCGDRTGAIERYERVAQYYVESKEANKALAVYQQVLNLDPQRLDVQARVAALHLQLGHAADGIALYERVAHAQMQLGRPADALVTYEIVADADPSAIARRLRLAELYSREKRKSEAVEAFRMAGAELRKAGRLADFVRVAERLLFHDEGDLETLRELARTYLELRDPRRALMKLNGLLRSNSTDEEGIELLAETFMALGKPEKALSALEELARSLRAKGPVARKDTIRILRRGLEWRPGHAEFREALSDLDGVRRSGPQATTQVVSTDETNELDEDELETIDEDELVELVELDEDDLVMDEPSAPGADDQVSAVVPSEPAPSIDLPEAASVAPGTRRTMEVEAAPSAEPSSLTQSVLSEVEGSPAELEGLTDFDKVLFEARVYIKYRLFEHALDHVETALQQQPEHVGALSLQARALTEMGKLDEAADVHVHVAQLVMERDPKLAREHVGAASSLVPGHARAEAMAQTPDKVSIDVPIDEDGDSGAFDLISEDFEDLGAELAAQVVGGSDEAAANLVDAHGELDESFDGESTQPFAPNEVAELEQVEQGQHQQEPAQTGMTLTPFGQPGELGGPSAADLGAGPEPELDFDLPVASEAQAVEGGWPDLSDDLAEIRFYVDQGLDEDAEAALDDLEEKYPGHPEIQAFRGPAEVEEAPVVEVGAAEPLLDVEAEPAQESLSTFDEDEDEDDYLSAIFADPSEHAKKSSAVPKASAGANLAEGQLVDASTAFDLGVAYREMGLVDAAISQFETAAEDLTWRARAMTMLGALRVHQGDTELAVANLQEALRLAGNGDEASEAAYELGLLFEKLGDISEAVRQLEGVTPGYRDRDQRLADLVS